MIGIFFILIFLWNFINGNTFPRYTHYNSVLLKEDENVEDLMLISKKDEFSTKLFEDNSNEQVISSGYKHNGTEDKNIEISNAISTNISASNQNQVNENSSPKPKLGEYDNPAKSCKELIEHNITDPKENKYWIMTSDGEHLQVMCPQNYTNLEIFPQLHLNPSQASNNTHPGLDFNIMNINTHKITKIPENNIERLSNISDMAKINISQRDDTMENSTNKTIENGFNESSTGAPSTPAVGESTTATSDSIESPSSPAASETTNAPSSPATSKSTETPSTQTASESTTAPLSPTVSASTTAPATVKSTEDPSPPTVSESTTAPSSPDATASTTAPATIESTEAPSSPIVSDSTTASASPDASESAIAPSSPPAASESTIAPSSPPAASESTIAPSSSPAASEGTPTTPTLLLKTNPKEKDLKVENDGINNKKTPFIFDLDPYEKEETETLEEYERAGNKQKNKKSKSYKEIFESKLFSRHGIRSNNLLRESREHYKSPTFMKFVSRGKVKKPKPQLKKQKKPKERKVPLYKVMSPLIHKYKNKATNDQPSLPTLAKSSVKYRAIR